MSAGLITWLLATVDLPRFWAALALADVKLLAMAAVAQVGVFLVLSFRYWVLLSAIEPCRFHKTLGSYYAGIFANNFLPTGVGGDVVRSWRLRGLDIEWDRLLSSSLVDRILGLISILFLGLCGIAASEHVTLDAQSLWLLGVIFLGLPLALYVVFSPRCHRWLRQIAGGLQRFSLVNFVFRMFDQCAQYKAYPGRLLLAIGLTVLLQSLTVAAYWLIGRALGIDLSLAAYFAIVPIVVVVTNLPISLGGIGLREGAMVALLLQFGAEQSLATANAMGYLGLLLLLSLPGGLVFMARAPIADPVNQGASGRTVEANEIRKTAPPDSASP